MDKKEKREYMREWRKKGTYKENHRKAQLKWVSKNRKKNHAHSKIANELKHGRMEKLPCEDCGAEIAHAHHDDYNKPKEVRWLCPLHHAEWHSKNTPVPPSL